MAIAICRSCGEPLVMTMAWRGFEFICMKCGRLETYFGPAAAEESPALIARCDELKAEWVALHDGLLPAGAYLTRCRDAGGGCRTEPHRRHATPEELAAHEAAAARIGERLGRAVE